MARRTRKKIHIEKDNTDRWLISYADFITLLFAFFVVLYATSEKDKDKGKALEESLKKYLVKIKVFGGGASSGDNSVSKILNRGGPSEKSILEGPLNSYKKLNTKKDDQTLLLQGKIEKLVESSLSEEQIEKSIFDIVDDEWGVRIILNSNYLFQKGDTLFRSSSLSELDTIGRLLKNLDLPLLFEGHVREGARKSKFASSWELSTLRATKVLRYYSKKFGLNQKQISLAAFGSQRPAISGAENINDARNDRIEILILPGESPL
ncbi:MAG: OmpA family protein [Bdellovibrionaceae bacterium]|jgi:chemotaxis protein MotB|nr:OmpA family protein [Pseudobdellovibrionaceae bacterium]